jgi:trimeric autotransporter adhesin
MKAKIAFIAFFLLTCSMGFSQNNTATGTSAGLSGTLNSSFGYFAGNKVTGSQNTFLGANAGFSTTSGNYNSFLGYSAGNISGSYNTLLGYQAGYSTTGSNNIFIGKQAGYGETGSNNL